MYSNNSYNIFTKSTVHKYDHSRHLHATQAVGIHAAVAERRSPRRRNRSTGTYELVLVRAGLGTSWHGTTWLGYELTGTLEEGRIWVTCPSYGLHLQLRRADGCCGRKTLTCFDIKLMSYLVRWKI